MLTHPPRFWKRGYVAACVTRPCRAESSVAAFPKMRNGWVLERCGCVVIAPGEDDFWIKLVEPWLQTQRPAQ